MTRTIVLDSIRVVAIIMDLRSDVRPITPGNVQAQRNRMKEAIENLIPDSARDAKKPEKAAADGVALSRTSRALAAEAAGDADVSFAQNALRYSRSSTRETRLEALHKAIQSGTYSPTERMTSVAPVLTDVLTRELL